MTLALLEHFIRETIEEGTCRVCGSNIDDTETDTCEKHESEPTQLQLLGSDSCFDFSQGKTVPSRPYRNSGGRPTMKSWGLS